MQKEKRWLAKKNRLLARENDLPDSFNIHPDRV